MWRYSIQPTLKQREPSCLTCTLSKFLTFLTTRRAQRLVFLYVGGTKSAKEPLQRYIIFGYLLTHLYKKSQKRPILQSFLASLPSSSSDVHLLQIGFPPMAAFQGAYCRIYEALCCVPGWVPNKSYPLTSQLYIKKNSYLCSPKQIRIKLTNIMKIEV